MAPLTRCVAGWRQRIELTDDATDDDDHDDGVGALLCDVAGDSVIFFVFVFFYFFLAQNQLLFSLVRLAV